MVPMALLEAERERTARLSALLPTLASPASLLHVALRDSEAQGRASEYRIKAKVELQARLEGYIVGLRKIRDIRGLNEGVEGS
jgi:hypothetical protein